MVEYSKGNDLLRYILNLLLMEALMAILDEDSEGRAWTDEVADKIEKIMETRY